MLKSRLRQLHREQAGQALILVLLLLVIGSMMLVPALALARDAAQSNRPYEIKTSELYTADAGIEEGLWRIKYEYFGTGYDAYNFNTTYRYEIDDVNGKTANLTIQNVWLPTNVTLASLGLSTAEARAIIEDEILVVTGSPGALSNQPYAIKVDYDPSKKDDYDPEVSENLCMKSVGIWLPQGFEYTAGSCDLDNPLNWAEPYYADNVSTGECPGGTYVVWSYNYPYPLFTAFPGIDTETLPMTTEIQFSYDPPADAPNSLPTAVAWVTTELQGGSESDYPVSWDVDTRFFQITSITGDTSIQAYASKSEMREIGDATNGDYLATGNSLMIGNVTKRDNLLSSSSANVSGVPSDGDAFKAYLYWTGWQKSSRIVSVFTDSCTNLGNWSYTSPSDWSVIDGSFQGTFTTDNETANLLTLSSGRDLSSYVPGTILVSWDQLSTGCFHDTCDDFDNWTNGSNWSENGYFRGRYNSGGDDALLTTTPGIDLSSYNGTTLTVSWDQWENDNNLGSSEGLDFAFSSDNGTTWSSYIQAFRNDIDGTERFSYEIPSEYVTSGFMLRFKLIGFTGYYYCYVDNIDISVPISPTEGLDFAVSGDGGSTWGKYVEAYRGETSEEYLYYLPAVYTTSNFKIRFKTVDLADGRSICIDNIRIRNLPADNQVSFQIDSDGTFSTTLNADVTSVLLTETGSTGFAFACHSDVTELVIAHAENTTDGHCTGNAYYTVGSLLADTGEYLSHAGWSLVIVYNSPSTAGHYLYLYDYFAFNGGSTNLDFDWDGVPGGDVTDFIIPEPIRDKNGNVIEEVAARITCFIGEGDDIYDGDYVILNYSLEDPGMYLENTASPWNDVWNGASPDMTNPGIDVDTFEVLWEDGYLRPGDTSLHLDMWSGTDAWNFIYLIISVRSETTTSGTTHYFINRN